MCHQDVSGLSWFVRMGFEGGVGIESVHSGFPLLLNQDVKHPASSRRSASAGTERLQKGEHLGGVSLRLLLGRRARRSARRRQQIAEIAALLFADNLRRGRKLAKIPIPLDEAEDGDKIHLLMRNVVGFGEGRDD
jgi:hypothetical protein